jgi:hypothetical protein
MTALMCPRFRAAGLFPVDLGSRHQHRNSVVADLDSSTEGEFGVDASSAVGAARCCVDLDDLIEQPGVAN